jgi:hypothetical protein
MSKRILSAACAIAAVFGGLAFSTPAVARGDGNSTSINCLTPPARAIILRIEAKFGPMEIISTCRPGATVRDTGRPSRHASGNAVDFIAGDRKGAVVSWLIANYTGGGTMTYSDSPHIHVDVGPHWVQLASGYRFTGGGDQPVRHTKHARAHAKPDKAVARHKTHRVHRAPAADAGATDTAN